MGRLEVRDQTRVPAESILETQLGGNLRVTLSQITDIYFSEETERRSETINNILYLNRLLQVGNTRLYMTPEILFPFISGKTQLDRDSLEAPNPKMTLFTLNSPEESFQERIIEGLESGVRASDYHIKVQAVKPEKLGFPEGKTHVYSIGKENEEKTDKIDSATQYITLEEKETALGAKYITLSLTATNYNVGDDIPKLDSLFSFDIRRYTSRKDRRFTVTNWDQDGLADWIVDKEEPYALLSEKAQQALNEPLDIKKDDFQRFIESFRYNDVNIYGPERNGRAYYYLELMMLAAKMIKYTVHSNGRTSIPERTLQKFQSEFKDRLSLLSQEEYRFGPTIPEDYQFPSPMEYLMYELLLNGKNIWDDLEDFNHMMAEAAEENPVLFLEQVRLFGLNKVIPAFQLIKKEDETQNLISLVLRENMSDGLSGLQNFYRSFYYTFGDLPKYQRGDSETVKDYFARLVSPVPDLLQYYSRRELVQSKEFYMKILLAFASYALRIGQSPIAAIVEREGIIIGYGFNTKKTNGDIIHAEYIATDMATEKLDKGDRKCNIYGTVEACDGCGLHMRWLLELQKAVFGRRSSMGTETKGAKRLSDPGLTRQEYKPPPEPDQIIFGVLKDDVLAFYIKVAEILNDPAWVDLVSEDI